MKKLIPKNGYVRNKDWQDPIAALKLSDDKLVDQLSKVGYVVHTIIPETTKYTEKNKVGMYTNPIDICIGPYGYLFMITYDNVKMESNLQSTAAQSSRKNWILKVGERAANMVQKWASILL